MDKKILTAVMSCSMWLHQWLSVNNFIIKSHRFTSMFGFSLVASKVFFRSSFRQLTYIKSFWCFFIMIFLHFSTPLLFLNHPLRSILFFSKQLLQVGENYSSDIHSNFENRNVSGHKNECKVNLYNIASV